MTVLQVVSGIVANSNGEVLLAQRPVGKHLAGFWEFPGGKVEPGESIAFALRRELQEELKLDIRTDIYLGCFRHQYDWGPIDLHVFRGIALCPPSLTVHVRDIRWVRPEDISKADLAPADLAPLAHYLALRSIN